MFGIGDDYNVEKTAKKIFGAKKIFHTPYSKNTNTLFKRKMSKTFTTLDSHTVNYSIHTNQHVHRGEKRAAVQNCVKNVS